MLQKQRRRNARSSQGDVPEEEPEEVPYAAETAPQKGLWLYLAVPAAGVLLCGSKEPWTLGVLALLIGLTALIATPSQFVPRTVTVPLLAALILCLGAFLPASWSPLPEWREILQRDFGIVMATTRSPQPWVTFEGWMVLLVSAIWLICCLGRGFSSGERRRAFRFLTLFLALLAGAAMAIGYAKASLPLWTLPDGTMQFGPFPNRNNFAGLLAIGVMLALATTHDAFRQKSRLRWLYLLAIVPMFVAVLSNTSRMGLLMLFAGSVSWMLCASMSRKWTKQTAVLVAVFLIMAAGAIVLGRPLLERIAGGEQGMIASLESDARWRIFADTARMVSGSPWFGVGLGNFEPVFAMTRHGGELHSRSIHPENDWLWLAAEAGAVCLLLVIFAGVKLATMFQWRRRQHSQGRRDRRLRIAAGIGVLMIWIEGLVNTPMHDVGFLAFGALLAGLALAPARSRARQPSPVIRSLVRKGWGVLSLVLGALWLLNATNRFPAFGGSQYHLLARQAAAQTARDDPAAALETWNEACAIKPIQWNIYFERAMVKLQLGMPPGDVFQDFSRWRQLERYNAKLCAREFDEWVNYHPANGVAALREAIRRDPSSAVAFFEQRLWRMKAFPELRPHFLALAKSEPKLALAYLPHATDEEFAGLIIDLTGDKAASLEVYTASEKLSLFSIWNERGDAAALTSLLEQRSDLREAGWSVLASQKAKAGDFEGAYKLALGYVPEPSRSAAGSEQKDLATLMRAFKAKPTDIIFGLELCDAQRLQDRLDDALATLDQLTKLSHSPARVWYEQAVIWAAKKDFAQAWTAILEYSKRAERERTEREQIQLTIDSS